MKAASAPRRASEVRILVSNPSGLHVARATDLASLLCPGDLVVVNDAATLPATFEAETELGEPLELRLLAAKGDDASFTVALLGRGDHTIRTEDRPPPPRVERGMRLRSRVDHDVYAEVRAVSTLSPRMVDVVFRTAEAADPDAVWAALYRVAKPVQYAHVPAPLALWDVQNVYAGRPWAVEMPSAGRALRAETILSLRRAGIAVARVTHAAGISSTGDPAIDERLPLPERFHVPWDTASAIIATHRRGGRVVAVGTSVVRALESAAQNGAITAADGITDLRLSPRTRRRVVDALLTGVHERDTSHFELLGAFASRGRLDDAMDRAEREGFLGHELGDVWLVWGDEIKNATFPVACGCHVGATLPAA
jgi:S-adenosylmethionine:tRNA ribosyltransferase-isomerase